MLPKQESPFSNTASFEDRPQSGAYSSSIEAVVATTPGSQASQSRQGTLDVVPRKGWPPIKLIPVERVCEIVGLKRSAVLALAAKGELPQKIKLGDPTNRRVPARWVEQEILDYAWELAARRPHWQPSPSPEPAVGRKSKRPGKPVAP